jgi:hypothetical protein
MAYSSISSMSYVSSVSNSGNGVRARFTFEGINNGKLDANDTWAVSFNNTNGPYTMLLNKSTSEQVEGVTAKILTSSAASGNVSGTLELYPLTAGTTYTFQAFDRAYTPTFYFDFTPTLDETPKTKNLASGTLAESVSASATTLLVYVGDGSATTIKGVWPDTPFYATLMPSNPTAGVPNSLDSEIVKVTDVGNDQVGNTILSVVRGQRGTTAKAFSAEAVVTNGIYTESILNRTYPVGSVFTSTNLSTASAVSNALGGTWELITDYQPVAYVCTSGNSGQTIVASKNISSVVKDGSSTYTVTFSKEMKNNKYIVVFNAEASGLGTEIGGAYGKSTTSFKVDNADNQGAAVAVSELNILVYGELATPEYYRWKRTA